MATPEASTELADALDAPLLEVKDHVNRGWHTISLAGELDMASGDLLQVMVRRLCNSEVAGITIDLSGLTFMDSTGLTATLQAQACCKEHGTGFALTRGQPPIHRLFELTGLADQLPFRDT